MNRDNLLNVLFLKTIWIPQVFFLFTLRFSPLCFSILSRVVCVTDEVVTYREWIKRNFPVRVDDNRVGDHAAVLLAHTLPAARTYASVATTKTCLNQSK